VDFWIKDPDSAVGIKVMNQQVLPCWDRKELVALQRPGLPTQKSRSIPFKGIVKGILDFGVISHLYPFVENSQQQIATVNYNRWQGSQVTVSENHPGWKKRKRLSSSDIGGNFFTQKRYATMGNVPYVASGSKTVYLLSGIPDRTTWYRYQGFMLPFDPSTFLAFPNFNYSSNAVLDAWGAKAIAQCKPTNSVADVSNFLGETIREGLPKLVGARTWRDRTLRAKTAADEYLNVEFGWKPLVSEINSMAEAITHAELVLNQYERDAGKMVRRRFEFPTETSVSSTVFLDGVNAYVTPTHALQAVSPSRQGRVIKTTTVSRRRWFSGAFTYYLPPRGTVAGDLARAKKLYGLSLTPDVVWNLTPWSWAVDWFTNTGDVLSNLTDMSVDGLVMRYGYMMEHTIVIDSYVFAGPTGFVGYQRPMPLNLVSETKIRRRASPFGFGITWGGLSPRQLSIAAALGINKR
jgi:hypothetical protein